MHISKHSILTAQNRPTTTTVYCSNRIKIADSRVVTVSV